MAYARKKSLAHHSDHSLGENMISRLPSRFLRFVGRQLLIKLEKVLDHACSPDFLRIPIGSLHWRLIQMEYFAKTYLHELGFRWIGSRQRRVWLNRWIVGEIHGRWLEQVISYLAFFLSRLSIEVLEIDWLSYSNRRISMTWHKRKDYRPSYLGEYVFCVLLLVKLSYWLFFSLSHS